MDCEEIIKFTENIISDWKNVEGVAPIAVVERLDVEILDSIIDMTKCLKIYEEHSWIGFTKGELILARTTLGSVTEAWLKFFLTVYFEDYEKNPVLTAKKKNPVKIEDLNFEKLCNYSMNILVESGSPFYRWIERVRNMRNGIHLFRKQDIGDEEQFRQDLQTYYEFISFISSRLPSVERDC